MPIVNDNDDDIVSTDPTKPVAEIKTIQITSPSISSIEVDNRWQPRMNLITHIEGSVWVVDYFSQVLTKDSQLSGQQVSLSAPYQQYTKINQMQMKVNSPLTTTQDENKNMLVVGEATLYPFIIPNDGDMFVADIGEGKLGVFEIDRTTKLTIFKEACYQISYKLITDDIQRISDLLNKTVKETFFHEKFVTLGKNPVVLSDEHSLILELQEAFQHTLNYYFKRFYSKEFKTMLVPAQSSTVYDHFLVSFLLSQFTTWDSQEIKHVTKFNIHDDDNMSSSSIWDAIKHRNISDLNLCFLKYKLISTRNFSNIPVAHGIRYTGVKTAVYPLDPIQSVDKTITSTYTVADSIQENQTLDQFDQNIRTTNLRSVTSAPVIDQQEITSNDYYTLSETGEKIFIFEQENFPLPVDPPAPPPSIKNVNLRNLQNTTKEEVPLVTSDEYYVLTKNFYLNDTEKMSVFEGLVISYIKKEPVDKANLLNICKLFPKWSLLQQFYYLPIVLVMIKSIIRGD